MPCETSIALQALLVSLTPTTHISAVGHRDKVAASVSAPGSPSIASGLVHCLRARPQHFSADCHRDKAAPPLPPASPATFYPQSSEQHHASEVSLKGVPVHWTPLEGFNEQETTLQGVVAALPVH